MYKCTFLRGNRTEKFLADSDTFEIFLKVYLIYMNTLIFNGVFLNHIGY